ncbi:PrsW family intramembrane metalloprotease [Actinomycetospora sp. OC33-EN08]|uniref:PrsW family intramembrane metalloprotease n=1 Tax=Actinomycetospora aurantiaca TaxID=3129233 RepID=A0ABU8MJW9_9PSEU
MIASPVRLAPQQRRTLVWPVVGLIVLGVCALAAVGLASTEIGPGGVIVGAICAMLPVGPVLLAFAWIDRWEPEPPRLLLTAFLWGAGFAALVALIINSSAVLAAELLLGQGQGDVVGAVISAPLVEEFVKGAFVVGLLLFRRREFDGIVDGIVYAGFVGAGFAFTENIIYFGRAFTDDGSAPVAGVIATFILRGLLSPFAHPLFTAMTGIGVGIAASVRSRALGAGAILLGYVLAVVLHALWNSATQLGPGFFGIYILIMVPLFLALIALVVWQRRREKEVLARQMPGFAAAGWIAESEVPLLGSMSGRRRWLTAVRRTAGKPAAAAVVHYQHAVSELAFLRARAERGAIPPDPRWHAELLDNVVRTRMAAVNAPGVPQQPPPGPPRPPTGPFPTAGPPGPPRPPQQQPYPPSGPWQQQPPSAPNPAQYPPSGPWQQPPPHY